MKTLLQLLRVKQYAKNLFIFLPSFFAMQFFNFELQIKNIIAFSSFSLLASTIYILNDILDKDTDRKHKKKKNRPIASGKISVPSAIIISVVILVCSFLLATLLNNNYVYILMGIYLVTNILYIFILKHIGIIDVLTIASGYIIRILIGGAATNVTINKWIIIMTFLLALFLAFAKRRDDVLIMEETGKKIRKSIEGYSLQFVDSALFITSAITLVAYIMYTISAETIQRYDSDYIYITSVFVLLGILRYLQITMVTKDSGSPTEVLYKDKVLQLAILGWLLSFGIIMYA
ncbi:MAG: decaprenyl-phosphate phosphoribosyltransferase [Candidatus Dojkabacteria bacterium]|jgi:decaprenyl-phosphate phosphoribosyltransferase